MEAVPLSIFSRLSVRRNKNSAHQVETNYKPQAHCSRQFTGNFTVAFFFYPFSTSSLALRVVLITLGLICRTIGEYQTNTMCLEKNCARGGQHSMFSECFHEQTAQLVSKGP